jgi:cytochrome c
VRDVPGDIESRRSRQQRRAGLVLAVCAWLPLTSMAAESDAARGAEQYAARCGGCHSVDADRIGPRHAGVFGRRAGSVLGFDYSPALKASAVVWDAKTLERWLANPESVIPGQRMGYSLGDAVVRADVIAYLATLNPK